MKIIGICLILFNLVFIPACKGKGVRPASVPPDAHYNRKINLYNKTVDGINFSWFENGNVVMKTKVTDIGISDGLSERLEYKTGKLISTGQYKMAEKSGTWFWNFSDGNPYYEMNFTPGIRKKVFWVPIIDWGNENGQYIRYFQNGRVNEKGNFDGGNRSGDWIKYYPDTKIESKGSFVADHKVGEWYYYYPDGRKEALEKYNALGILEYRVTYYPNGSIWCETKKTEFICN